MYEILYNTLKVLLIGFVLAQVASLLTTVYLHRALTHNALKLNPIVEKLFAFVIVLLTGIVPREWVGVHRKHHKHTDVDGDPHSPLREGFGQIQWWNVKYYRRATREKEVLAQYAPDLYSDLSWFQQHVVARFIWVLPLFGIILLCLIFGVGTGIASAAVHYILYVHVLSSSINALGHTQHRLGYQVYSEAEHAKTVFNNKLIASVTCGEGFHHNHHVRPDCAIFGHRPSERWLDFGWLAIRLLEKLKLASEVNRRLPSIAESH